MDDRSWDKAECVREVLAFRGERPSVDLDDFGELVAARGLSTDQLDELLTAVEEAGCPVVMGAAPRLREELVAVLSAARAFLKSKGRRPTIAELVSVTELPDAVVWRALRYGQVLSR